MKAYDEVWITDLDDQGPYAGEHETAYFERLARTAAQQRRQERRRALFGRLMPLRRS